MIDVNNPSGTLAAILRKRQEADLQRQQAGRFQGIAQQANTSGVVGGGNVSGMQGMSQATPQAIDWGGIIQGAAGNYLAARKEKEASQSSQEAEELNRQFMMETIGQDQEAQRLLQMAQAGIPGAEQALADRVAPKKEAMGAFLQYIQTGNADPAMAAELAPRYGLSPEIGMQAATSFRQNMMDASERDFQQKAALKQQDFSQRVALKGIPQAKAMAVGPNGEYIPTEGGGMEPNTAQPGANLTPGQLQIRDRQLIEWDKERATIESQMGKYEQLRPIVSEAFGPTQKISEILTNAADRLPMGLGAPVGAAGAVMRNEANALLKDYVNSEVLKRMAALGGNDSNEELRRMTASLPSAEQDANVAMALMDSLHRYETIGQRVLQKRTEILANEGAAGLAPGRNLYRQAEAELIAEGAIGPKIDLSPKKGRTQQPAPAAPQAAPTQQQAPVPAPMAAPGTITTPSGLKIRIKQ